jgi:hypothetical protein
MFWRLILMSDSFVNAGIERRQQSLRWCGRREATIAEGGLARVRGGRVRGGQETAGVHRQVPTQGPPGQSTSNLEFPSCCFLVVSSVAWQEEVSPE